MLFQKSEIKENHVFSFGPKFLVKLPEVGFTEVFDNQYYQNFDDSYVPEEFEGEYLWELDNELVEDIYVESRKIIDFPLIPDANREEIDKIKGTIAEFEDIIKKSVRFRHETYSNGLIISGAPGSGKTHNIMKWLGEIIEAGELTEIQKLSGKLTPLSLYQFMSSNSSEKVQVLDDCDVFYNAESLNLLKAGLDTKSTLHENRNVTYGSRGSINSHQYDSFMIMITNEKFENPNPHVAALLDRVHMVEIPLTPRDMFILNLSITEEYLATESRVTPLIKRMIRDFINTEVQDYVDYGLFAKTNINFSVRFVMKIVDLIVMFGEKWKKFSREYKRLSAELALVKSTNN